MSDNILYLSEGADRIKQSNTVGVADGLTRMMANGQSLNNGQWEAMTGLLGTENRVNLVEGPAGAGRSSLLGKINEGMNRAGQSVTWLAST